MRTNHLIYYPKIVVRVERIFSRLYKYDGEPHTYTHTPSKLKVKTESFTCEMKPLNILSFGATSH